MNLCDNNAFSFRNLYITMLQRKPESKGGGVLHLPTLNNDENYFCCDSSFRLKFSYLNCR